MRSIKINRAKWRSGGYSSDAKKACGIGDTRLLNGKGFMCCLGFATQQLARKSKDTFEDVTLPQNLKYVISKLTYKDEYDRKVATPLTDKAVDINDNEDITLKQRESRLIKLFAKHGLELTFFGEYTKGNRV